MSITDQLVNNLIWSLASILVGLALLAILVSVIVERQR